MCDGQKVSRGEEWKMRMQTVMECRSPGSGDWVHSWRLGGWMDEGGARWNKDGDRWNTMIKKMKRPVARGRRQTSCYVSSDLLTLDSHQPVLTRRHSERRRNTITPEWHHICNGIPGETPQWCTKSQNITQDACRKSQGKKYKKNTHNLGEHEEKHSLLPWSANRKPESSYFHCNCWKK